MTLQNGMKWEYRTINDDLSNVANFLTKNNTHGRVKREYNDDHVKLMIGMNGKVISIVSENTGIIYGTIGISNSNISSCVFLCVHEKLRKKKMAKVLCEHAKEMYGDNKCFFLTTKKINNPLCYVQKFIRPLNYEKLYDCKFLFVKNNLEKTTSYFKVLNDKQENIREYNENDLDILYNIYKENSDKFTMFINYDFESFKMLISNPVVKTFVTLNDDNQLVDFISYCLMTNFNGKYNFIEANMLMFTNTKMSAYEMVYNSMPYINEYADLITTHNIGYGSEFIGCNINHVDNTQNFAYEMKFLVDSDLLLHGSGSGLDVLKLSNQEIWWIIL